MESCYVLDPRLGRQFPGPHQPLYNEKPARLQVPEKHQISVIALG